MPRATQRIMPSRPRAIRIAGLLKQATADDLADMDGAIQDAEAQVKALRAARDLIAESVLNRADAKPEAKPPAKPTPAAPAPRGPVFPDPSPAPSANGHGEGFDYTEMIAKYIAMAGPAKPQAIAHALGAVEEDIKEALDQDQYFTRIAGWKYELTSVGRRKFVPKEDE